MTQAGKKPSKPKKLSVQTTNDYLQAISQLCVWTVDNSRMERNPFQQIQKGNPEKDRRRVRRVLDADELRTLITVTQASETTFRHLLGNDRAVLYAVAAATGYRASELAALFRTDRGQATLDLGADSTKNSKAAVQPISVALADVLREYLAGRAADEPVWPGTWSERGADMIKADAEAAGVATEIMTKDSPQALDFHSLRGTFATFLDSINVSLKARQELMRHSDPRLTMNRYTRTKLSELGEAATKMPVLITAPTPPLDDSGLESTCTKLALTRAGESGFGQVIAEGKEIGEQLSLLADQLEKHCKSRH